ncbi:hypothetical protein PQX77_006939 [Marasmius sp. AFHP31]|nr:hypothetical protein PQX77_006939 [Marasmius sp. AFHP31]
MSCYYFGKSVNEIVYKSPPVAIPNRQGCYLPEGDIVLYKAWIMVVIYDTVTFILMMIPVARAYRRGGRAGVIKVIYQDGIKFFAVMFLCSMANIMVIVANPRFAFLLTSAERVLHSTIASRAILHIRKQSSKQEILVTSGQQFRLNNLHLEASVTMTDA